MPASPFLFSGGARLGDAREGTGRTCRGNGGRKSPPLPLFVCSGERGSCAPRQSRIPSFVLPLVRFADARRQQEERVAGMAGVRVRLYLCSLPSTRGRAIAIYLVTKRSCASQTSGPSLRGKHE